MRPWETALPGQFGLTSRLSVADSCHGRQRAGWHVGCCIGAAGSWGGDWWQVAIAGDVAGRACREPRTVQNPSQQRTKHWCPFMRHWAAVMGPTLRTYQWQVVSCLGRNSWRVCTGRHKAGNRPDWSKRCWGARRSSVRASQWPSGPFEGGPPSDVGQAKPLGGVLSLHRPRARLCLSRRLHPSAVNCLFQWPWPRTWGCCQDIRANQVCQCISQRWFGLFPPRLSTGMD